MAQSPLQNRCEKCGREKFPAVPTVSEIKKAIREIGPTVCIRTLADYMRVEETSLRTVLGLLREDLLVDSRPCGHCGSERVRLLGFFDHSIFKKITS